MSNQLEGGFFQSTSWMLCEQVAFDQKRILSQDGDTYPILRFSGAPEIAVVLLNRAQNQFRKITKPGMATIAKMRFQTYLEAKKSKAAKIPFLERFLARIWNAWPAYWSQNKRRHSHNRLNREVKDALLESLVTPRRNGQRAV